MNVTDRRRLLGPSNAKSANIPETRTSSPSKRSEDEIRKMFLKTGLVGNANGSAYLEVDDTIIEVSVFGPRPIKGSFIDRASFSVECKFLPHIPQPNEETFKNQSGSASNVRTGLTTVEQKLSSYIETAFLHSIILEKYPKSTIDVFVTIISADTTSSSNKSLLNLCNWVSNCTSLALVDSGIEVKDMVTSGQVSLNKSTNKILMDPDYSNNYSEDDSVDCVCSYMNMLNDVVVGFWIDGNQDDLDEQTMQKLFENCNGMSKKIRSNFNSYLRGTIE
ncbi:exosome complex component Mtr3p [[Candida] railenensis]|uniref:Exosome complex component Mtr3p n=1 Tax=[Candida] railenensis TaxID=45579 RepID=A0A9P0QVH1_9ASCO|nr:exosome complex component Mtr3p [[Candida] railenensis]